MKSAFVMLLTTLAMSTLTGCAHSATKPALQEPAPLVHQSALSRQSSPTKAAPPVQQATQLKLSGKQGLSLSKADDVGYASYYGRRFAGRLTANGERFDPNKLTAAHRSLPFGTRVRVTNLSNGRHVTVRINDRGPFVDSRIIDLSRQAAKQLGMLKKGVTKVRLQVLNAGQAK